MYPPPPSSSFVTQHQGREQGEPEAVHTFSPDGLHVAVCGPNHTVEVWDARFSGRRLAYDGHQDGLYRRLTGRILAIAWSPDGRRIASLSSTGSLQVWDARTGIHQHTLLPASDDATRVPAQEQEGELLWDTDGLRLSRKRGQEQRVWHL